MEAVLLSDRKILQVPITGLTIIAGLAMVAMMLHIVADVIGRMVFNHPFNGTTEIVSSYDMVMVIFLPLAYVTRHGGHIMVELFTQRWPKRRIAALDAIVGAVCLALVVWFTWETVVAAQISFDQNEQWPTAADLVTVWPSRWFLPIGLGLMAIYMLCRMIDDARIALSKDG
jgi:TRAP-type C4-dicarboxylate transport system permease small subunit